MTEKETGALDRSQAQRELRDRCELANCPNCRILVFKETDKEEPAPLHDVYLDAGYVPGLELHACDQINRDALEGGWHADGGPHS